MGYLFVFLKTVANLGEGVLIKKYDAKHKAGGMFFTGVLSLFAFLFFLVSDRDGLYFPEGMLPYSAAFGLIYCVSYYLTFVAISCGPFTISMLIISYYLVVPIIYGIVWMHDPVSPFTCIGFVLLMISLFLVREAKDENENRKISFKWIVAVTITTLGNGLLSIIQKVQQVKFENRCNNEFMMVALAISAAVLLIIGVVKDRRDLKEILRYGIPYAGSAGVANGLTNLFTILANNMLPISVISPVSSGLKIVLLFITSRFILKEVYIKRQIVGVAVGAAALIFLNL